MGKESLNNGWHTFPDEPDTWEDVETVYLVSESYYRKTSKGKWEFECYQAFCLWNWEDHRFMDVFSNEYFFGLETSIDYSDHKLFWKEADLPPGMEKYADKIYGELCRQCVEPFYVPERPPYTQDEIEDMINERRWEERNGR